MRLVVLYKSHREVRFIIDEYGLRPTILLVLVPGIREGDNLEPAPEVTAEEIPHVWGGGVPSHIVPVGPDGSSEGIDLRPGDRVVLIHDTPPIIVWATARLAANLQTNIVADLVNGNSVIALVPIIPKAVPVEGA